MTLGQRFPYLLSDPEYALSDVYDSPQIGQAFLLVSMYAGFSAFNAFVSAVVTSSSFSLGIFSFILSAFLVYVSWIFLSIVLHVVATVVGGLGEIPNTLAFVGFGTAPLIATSIVSIVLNMIGPVVLEDDPDHILPLVRLGLTLLGLAWGWTGVLCYYGLKNGDRLHPLKAASIALLLFIVFSSIELATFDPST
jgi:hypothetical protein